MQTVYVVHYSSTSDDSIIVGVYDDKETALSHLRDNRFITPVIVNKTQKDED